ncbi:MAG TPA: PIG-L deacetylase family protein [Candidatus Saccharimonadales bacterium]|nr:PIG-L deacetylase family protein [Candidatus Saccharimonadales bacterium]
MDQYEQIFANKQTILVVMAHPDDLDAMCGGTVARLCADGKKVVSVKVTTGNRGSQDSTIAPQELAKIRAQEDAKAMKVLGVHQSVSLGLDDGTVTNSQEVIEKIAYQIRTFQPDLIMTTNPEHVVIHRGPGKNHVNHRDHRNVAISTVDAAYPFSRDRAFFAEQFKDSGLRPSTCNEMLFVDSWDGTDEVTVSIKGYEAQKRAAIASHKSQFTEQSAHDVFNYFTREGHQEVFRHIVFN